MRESYKNLSNNPSDAEVVEWLRQATRERDIDLEDYQSQIENNPYIFPAPSSSDDLKGTEKVGDLAMDSNYIYIVVDNGGLVWRSIPLTNVLTNDRKLTLNDGIIITSTTVANTTTETTVYTEPIGSNELMLGEVVKAYLYGFYSTANGTDTFTARLKLGGTTVATITSTAANVTDAGWDIDFSFTIRSLGASGTFISYTRAIFNEESKTAVDTSASTIDTTVDEDLTLTVEWSNALSGNTFTITQGWVEFIG